MNYTKLQEFIEWQHSIRIEAHLNKELGFDEPLKNFINLMRALPPQNYGTRIQNRIIKNLHFKKVKSSDNCGDCLDNFGDPYEIKTSIIDGVNINLNVVNIRDWQEVNYYIVGFDVRNDEKFKCYFFRISKNEMLRELEIFKATASIGTNESNKNNECVEKRFSIEIDSPSWFRWCDMYLSKASNLI